MTAPAPLPDLSRLTDAVLERQGHREGGEIRFRCPQPDHVDEHPSARWNPKKGVWCCDACSAGGGFSKLADLLGIAPEAKWNSERHHRTMQSARPMKSRTPQWCKAKPIESALERIYWDAVRKQWPGRLPVAAEGRGFEAADGPTLGFTRWPGGDLMFPLLDPLNNIVGAKVRLAKQGSAKYLPVGPNTNHPTYRRPKWPGGGNDRAWCSPGISSMDTVLIVEGELSAMIAFLAVGDMLGVMGTNGTSGKLWREVFEGRHVLVYADGDAAGQKALERWADESRIAGAKTVTTLGPLDGGMDFCDFAHQHGREALRDWLA